MSLFQDDIECYRRLLVSIIWLAVYDACAKPIAISSRNLYHRPTDEALSAIRFMFNDDPETYYSKYLECLGMDPEAFRNKLVHTMYGQQPLHHLPFGGLPDGAKKNFRFNHAFWLTHEKGATHDTHQESRGNPEPDPVQPTSWPFGSGHSDQGATRENRPIVIRHRT